MIIDGLVNTGDVYGEKLFRSMDGNTIVIFEYIRIIFSPWLIGVIPLTIVYWWRLANSTRLVCILAIALNLALYIGTGTNKGLADFLLIFPWMLYMSLASGISQLRISIKRLFSYIIIFTTSIFLSLISLCKLKFKGVVELELMAY